MGGSVTVAIRLSDGTAVCQDHWTNSTSYWLKRPALYRSDEGARAYLAKYERERDPGRRYDYGDPVRLGLGEYGIIVIDYVTRTILENNGYTDLGTFEAVKQEIDGEHSAFRECADAGILSLRTITFDKTEPKWTITSDETTGPLTAAEVEREAKRINGYDRPFSIRGAFGKPRRETFVIDTAPFTLERHPEGRMKPIRERLVEMGFPLNRRQGLNAR
jgi:hypothetical protein